MQETIDDALLRLNTSVLTSYVGSTGPSADGAFSASNKKRHRPAPISGDWSSHNCNSTLTNRAVCSARSRYRAIQYRLSATRDNIPTSREKVCTK